MIGLLENAPPLTQPTAGQFYFIILQLKKCRHLPVWVIHIIGRDVRGYMNYTCIQLNITSTCVCVLPEGSSGDLL